MDVLLTDENYIVVVTHGYSNITDHLLTNYDNL